MTARTRRYGALTAPEVPEALTADSVLCLPIGSMEHHGPHLPLHTDLTLAEGIAAALVDRYGTTHDLWTLPSIAYGLSLEHAWSPGTVSLTTNAYATLLHQIVAEYTRATPARRLLIVNGHGGNKGVLQALTQELQHSHGIAALAASSAADAGPRPAIAEVHAGADETSLMLALAPDEGHLDRLPADNRDGASPRCGTGAIDAMEIHQQILDRAVTWPWSSGDPAIAHHGVTGEDPRTASAAQGRRLLDRALDTCQPYLDRLRTATPAPAWRRR